MAAAESGSGAARAPWHPEGRDPTVLVTGTSSDQDVVAAAAAAAAAVVVVVGWAAVGWAAGYGCSAATLHAAWQCGAWLPDWVAEAAAWAGHVVGRLLAGLLVAVAAVAAAAVVVVVVAVAAAAGAAVVAVAAVAAADVAAAVVAVDATSLVA